MFLTNGPAKSYARIFVEKVKFSPCRGLAQVLCTSYTLFWVELNWPFEGVNFILSEHSKDVYRTLLKTACLKIGTCIFRTFLFGFCSALAMASPQP